MVTAVKISSTASDVTIFLGCRPKMLRQENLRFSPQPGSECSALSSLLSDVDNTDDVFVGESTAHTDDNHDFGE